MGSLTTFTVIGFKINIQCYEITVDGNNYTKKLSTFISFHYIYA